MELELQRAPMSRVQALYASQYPRLSLVGNSSLVLSFLSATAIANSIID
jgi:hypothetical protein